MVCLIKLNFEVIRTEGWSLPENKAMSRCSMHSRKCLGGETMRDAGIFTPPNKMRDDSEGGHCLGCLKNLHWKKKSIRIGWWDQQHRR